MKTTIEMKMYLEPMDDFEYSPTSQLWYKLKEVCDNAGYIADNFDTYKKEGVVKATFIEVKKGKIKQLQKQRNELNRKISTLKKATLRTE